MALSRRIYFAYSWTILVLIQWNIELCEAGELRDLFQFCPDRTFGYKCKYNCHCDGGDPCDKVTGSCYMGCLRGYWGPGCQLSDNCFYNGQARHYMGRENRTVNTNTCQAWSIQTPHRHSYEEKDFPDRTIPLNFCRTTKDSSRPWCYTTNKKQRWEHCDVNNCNCPIGRFGHNCAKECHCKSSADECDSIMGMCQFGCATGWTGFDCQTPVPCPLKNMYGWDCSQRCHCKNPDHCDRFTGPTTQCECEEGFFRPPSCEAVTRPRIIHFGNTKVNPGQPSVFNCTVAAYPPPRETEIRLLTPLGKMTTLLQSLQLENNRYTRSSLFQVNAVNADEKYSCVIRSVAGEVSYTTVADVYERPMLLNPPKVKSPLTGTTIPIVWHPWSQARGDTGDPPITWYSVWLRTTKESSFRMLVVVLELDCLKTGLCNYTMKGLSPNTDYVIYISVRRQGDIMDGPPGPMIYVKTSCDVPSLSPIVTSVTGELQVNNTYPKTRLVVKWQDAPTSSWNCDDILRYQIIISNGDPEQVLVTHLSGDAEKQVSIPKQEPATKYCVKIKFQNSGEFFSPVSPEVCVVSPSTIPSAPTSLSLLRRSSTTLTFTWERPDDTRGNITAYTVIYWKGYIRELSTKKGVELRSTDALVEFTLNGLEPHTKYHIQVQALNAAGPGEYSNILTTVTEEARPAALMLFHNISRTQRSIELQWEPPDRPNGVIKYYMLSCEKPEVLFSDAPRTTIDKRIQFGAMLYNFTGLEPATLYRCNINATNSKGSGPSRIIKVWTEALDPAEPPPPKILGRSDSTVTVELKPIQEQAVSFYRIIVEEVVENKRVQRSIPGDVGDTHADFHTAERNGDVAYVAAQLDQTKAQGPFVVGDNDTYSGFYNAPLHPRRKYNIWFGAYSQADGVLRKSVSKAQHPAVAQSAITAAPPINHVPVIIGVLVVFIVLILVVALLLFIWRKRYLQAEREKAEMPNFGPTIIPEPDPTPPSTPIEKIETEPLIEACSVSEDESEPIYGNVGFSVAPIKVEDLWDFVKNNKCNDMEGFRREYKLIPAGITANCEAAKKVENKAKNRYGNIVAYDHTRVVLLDKGNDIHDDYINANYIDGYNKPKAYIAAQGPTPPTLKDIWRMVWQENSRTIIMLTNPTETGKKKCEPYWPMGEEGQTYNGILVEHLGTESLPDFTTRTFRLTRDEEQRTIKQFHYTTWPDHGVPRYSGSLLLLRQKIRAHDSLDTGPPVVHCSAGVGRTGTYIAIDVELEHAKTEGIVDVHNFVQLMRTQRINMVQTMDQYVFVYDCLLEALISGDTTMRSDEYADILSEMCQFDNTIQKTKLEEQFDVLRLITTTIERDETTTALKAENIFKNRCKTIIPANRCRPYLMTPAEGSNDYINAVFTNSYTCRDGFVATQMPLPNTVIDFWRLVYDHHISTIVMLNEIDEADETCEQYWSLEPCGESYGPFIVETSAEIKSDPSITIRDFIVSNAEMPHEVPRIVRQFHFHRWSEGAVVPSSKMALFELLDMVDSNQRQAGNRPVVVHCLNGAQRSGLYVAISSILERLKHEGEIDVFHTIKQLRLSRSQFVDNLEQFRYCHEIVLDYLNSTKTLTTFK